MQRFEFRLERVLQWQLKVCRLAEEHLRLCRLAVAETEEQLRRLKSNSLTMEHEMLSRKIIASPDLRALARHRIKTVKGEQSLLQQRQNDLRAVEEHKAKLVAERNRLRQIEKLRERALQEHTVSVDRELETLALESHLSKWVTSTQSGDPV